MFKHLSLNGNKLGKFSHFVLQRKGINGCEMGEGCLMQVLQPHLYPAQRGEIGRKLQIYCLI